MAASVMASMALKSSPSPSPFLGRPRLRGIQPSTRRVMAKKAKKIKTSQPFGPGGGLNLKDGVDASGRPVKGKGVYQFASKYGANVDGYRKNRVVALGSHLLEFCWVVLFLYTILVPRLPEAWV